MLTESSFDIGMNMIALPQRDAALRVCSFGSRRLQPFMSGGNKTEDEIAQIFVDVLTSPVQSKSVYRRTVETRICPLLW